MKNLLPVLVLVLGVFAVGFIVLKGKQPDAGPAVVSPRTTSDDAKPARSSKPASSSKGASPKTRQVSLSDAPGFGDGGSSIGDAITAGIPPGAGFQGSSSSVQVFGGDAETLKMLQPQIEEMARNQRTADIDKKMGGIKQFVKMNPEQENRLADFLNSQRDPAADFISKILGGQAPMQAEVEEFAASVIGTDENPQLDRFMDTLLNDEQKEQFKAFRKDEARSEIESQTNMQMAQMQSLLRLKPDQADALRDVLRADATANVGAGFTAQSYVDRQEKMKEDLAPILTPQQMETYIKKMSAPRGIDFSELQPSSGNFGNGGR